MTKDHEQKSSKMDASLDNNSKKLSEFKVREDKMQEDLKEDLEKLNKEMKNSFEKIKQEIKTVKSKIDENIDLNTRTEAQNHELVVGKLKLIGENLEDHGSKHKVKREELLVTTKRIDDLIESTNNKFHEAQKNQLSNDNFHESMRDLISNYYQHCEDVTKNFKQKITYSVYIYEQIVCHTDRIHN